MPRRSTFPTRAGLVLGVLCAVVLVAAGDGDRADAAPVEHVGHHDLRWRVTDAAGAAPPDRFGGDGARPWGGADRIWSQPGFTGSYRIEVDGAPTAAYCADFHNGLSPDAHSRWVEDRSAFRGSDKALVKLSYAQWRWGASTDPDVGAALALYTHFLGSPGDRSNRSGVPVPDIDDDDVLDEVVVTLEPHAGVAPVMYEMDAASEAWSASFDHRVDHLAAGLRLDDDGTHARVVAVATGRALPDHTYDLTRSDRSVTVTTAGVARPIRDASHGSQNSVVAGEPRRLVAPVPVPEPVPPAAEVHLRTTVSATSRTEWINAQDAAPIAHAPIAAPVDPSAGSHDGSRPDEGDGVPVYPAGDHVTFRHEVWLDDASTGAVRWPGGPVGLVVDGDDGTVRPDYVDGDDGDGLLEPGEVWTYRSARRRARAGAQITSVGTVPAGAVVGIDGTPTDATTTPRRDPAGYLVPCLSTEAADPDDGDRLLDPGGGTVLDRLTFCNLVPGTTYRVDATVVRVDASGTVTPTAWTASHTFVPSAPDGTTTVEVDLGDVASGSSPDSGAHVLYERVSVADSGCWGVASSTAAVCCGS